MQEADTQPRDENRAKNAESDVHELEVDGRHFILVGTAHISRESVDLVREVIDKERPDCVCVELDPQRYEALSQESRWESLDLRQIIRNKQLTTLLMNLLLSSYQRRLGLQLGVTPGSELLEATRAADEYGIPIALCDRDIRVTLRRAWHSIGFFRKVSLVVSLLAWGCATPIEVSEGWPEGRRLSRVTLNPGDTIQVVFHSHPELNADQAQTIRPDGKISIPLIDEVLAADMTPAELDVKLTQLLKTQLIDPDLTVLVTTGV